MIRSSDELQTLAELMLLAADILRRLSVKASATGGLSEERELALRVETIARDIAALVGSKH